MFHPSLLAVTLSLPLVQLPGDQLPAPMTLVPLHLLTPTRASDVAAHTWPQASLWGPSLGSLSGVPLWGPTHCDIAGDSPAVEALAGPFLNSSTLTPGLNPLGLLHPTLSASEALVPGQFGLSLPSASCLATPAVAKADSQLSP